MLLQQLRLQNIRSYIDETINFPEGNTLLSGDIGSGKSTILLAIEFALFGSSRPDLPAESLLRKGSTKGMVELTIVLNNQIVTIQRNLKKERDTIKQMPGHITINNLKKELMPVELKAEMLSLLGYPEDLLTKNKNYIFRYTVYTPQEEMKIILQENNEIRQDALRKIFNIDKYKIIRENMQIYLKKLRVDLAVLTTKTEALPEYQQQLQQRQQEREKIERVLTEIKPNLGILQEHHQQQSLELQNLERAQKEFFVLQQEVKTTLFLLEEKKKRAELLETKQQKIQGEIAQLFLPEKSLDLIQGELSKAEEQKNHYLTQKLTLEEKIKHLQELIQRLQQENAEIILETNKNEETKKLKTEILQAVAEKEMILDKKTEIDQLFEKTAELLAKNKNVLLHAQEAQENIRSLDNCPTCFQAVSAEHKHKIISLEQVKSTKAQQLLEGLQQKKSEIAAQKETIEKSLLAILSKENLLPRIDYELQQQQKKKEQLGLKKEYLRTLIQQNNQVMQEQQEFLQQWKIEEIDRSIKEKQELLRSFAQKMMLEKNLNETIMLLEENRKNTADLFQRKKELEEKIVQRTDLTPKIENQKKVLLKIIEEEKQIAVKIAQLETQVESIHRHQQEITERIKLLLKETEKKVRLQQLYSWLEEHFLPLTSTIEKHVMVNIHRHFSLSFQEWFSILIDDENVSSHLDDSFAPIILQNGYEIPFSDLSGGEKTSAALAYRLALNKVINDIIHTINTKDLLILDEPTDGFSSEQLDKVREVLEKLQLQQILIVSHESKIESFVENIIKIQKEGHSSSVL